MQVYITILNTYSHTHIHTLKHNTERHYSVNNVYYLSTSMFYDDSISKQRMTRFN